jgi:hypothetical protein
MDSGKRCWVTRALRARPRPALCDAVCTGGWDGEGDKGAAAEGGCDSLSEAAIAAATGVCDIR